MEKVREDYFVKIPNCFVYCSDGEESSFMEMDKNNKHLIALLYNLSDKVNRKGICTFTIEMLLEDMGLKPNGEKGKINDKIKAQLMLLEDYGYIVDVSTSIGKAKITTPIKCRIDEDLFGNSFFMLYDYDYELIMGREDLSGEEKFSMLNIYGYILARYEGDYKAEKYRDNFTYFKMDDATKHLNIAKNTFIKAKQLLIEANLIKADNIGKVKIKTKNTKGKTIDKVTNCSEIYAFTSIGLSKGLESSRNYYKNKYGNKNIIYKPKYEELV